MLKHVFLEGGQLNQDGVSTRASERIWIIYLHANKHNANSIRVKMVRRNHSHDETPVS